MISSRAGTVSSVLRLGLTGGIGSGKSTGARRLVERGAVLVDSDVLAREVVAPGTEGLAEIVEVFGAGVLDAQGALDRPALAATVFGDEQARHRLNRIVHPRVRRRSDELIAAAAPGSVVVQDVPLLVEGGIAAAFVLVVVVHADAEERVRRLVTHRGMSEPDARARIAAQADDAARRAAADVWLDNSGAPADLAAAVDALWDGRLVAFEENLRLRRPAAAAVPDALTSNAEWAASAARLAARARLAAGAHGRDVAHVGPTAVPGLPAADVIDLQLSVPAAADATAIRDALADAGFPWRGDAVDDAGRTTQLHGTADPGRPATLHVREIGSPGWRSALLIRDWMRADPAARAGYAAAGAWLDSALPRAEEWAGASGWEPSGH